MIAGLIQYSLQQRHLGDAGMKAGAVSEDGQKIVHDPLTYEEKQRMWVVAILVVFIMTFFFVFEQAAPPSTSSPTNIPAAASWAGPSPPPGSSP